MVSAFSIDSQLFYFLTRIIPDIYSLYLLSGIKKILDDRINTYFNHVYCILYQVKQSIFSLFFCFFHKEPLQLLIYLFIFVYLMFLLGE
jgi:hypothetical protein